MNQPYVKEYNDNGRVTNPLTQSYISKFPNRKKRRSVLQKNRFFGESNNTHLTVIKNLKYYRSKQLIHLNDKEGKPTGKRKVIEHYILKQIK